MNEALKIAASAATDEQLLDLLHVLDPNAAHAQGKILIDCHFAQTTLWMEPARPSQLVEPRPCNDGSCWYAACPLYDNAKRSPH